VPGLCRCKHSRVAGGACLVARNNDVGLHVNINSPRSANHTFQPAALTQPAIPKNRRPRTCRYAESFLTKAPPFAIIYINQVCLTSFLGIGPLPRFANSPFLCIVNLAARLASRAVIPIMSYNMEDTQNSAPSSAPANKVVAVRKGTDGTQNASKR